MSISSMSTMNGNELRPLRRMREPTMQELFAPRIKERGSISPDQALVHMVKVMMGTGMLSLPLAFKHSGLWVVNVNMFLAQFGFCCVYFVFMADNLKQFFDQTSNIHISQAGWIALLLVPIMGLCTIRELKALAPLAAIANVVYLVAVCIVLQQLFQIERPTWSLPAVGNWSTLPLFFGTVMFAFEGVAVVTFGEPKYWSHSYAQVLPIENQMDEPLHFITNNGVLNTSCLLVLVLYMTVGFFGYLRFGDGIMDTLTLNLPQTNFYQAIKLMFVACILVSYPLQFYVPMERIEKWIKRKVAIERQEKLIYGARMGGVICTCLVAELIPHLALFISLVGSVAGTSLTLVFPPMIELLCSYSKDSLTPWIWIRNISLMLFAVFGFATGTYASLVQIVEAFGKSDV
ncbi:transmembrane amino acid transporter protein [Ancylostoma ceylanicum]|uniref:Transmembrane amino acid transporter protein n=1 Tax=Ancylostoma ceylanicum TaxID=53326 RepID=A0A0D6MD51_9BILA|nr:transmembrane amino acid transporter protein [Ancylostoma ceylanicum]